MDVEGFIKRWKASGGSESANFHSFAHDLTDLLGVPRPDPATGDLKRDSYRFAHLELTLTGMYNVLEKLRAGQRIEGKDREIYDQGLVGILRDLHDQIDREVAAAYGWPADLSDDEILHRLVDLNRERAAEEARGLVRWLRPDY